MQYNKYKRLRNSYFWFCPQFFSLPFPIMCFYLISVFDFTTPCLSWIFKYVCLVLPFYYLFSIFASQTFFTNFLFSILCRCLDQIIYLSSINVDSIFRFSFIIVFLNLSIFIWTHYFFWCLFSLLPRTFIIHRIIKNKCIFITFTFCLPFFYFYS